MICSGLIERLYELQEQREKKTSEGEEKDV